MEKKFVQHCETKVVANACNASYMITKMAKMPKYLYFYSVTMFFENTMVIVENVF